VFLSLESLIQASSALALFECERSCPSNHSFRPAAPWYYSSAGVLVPRIVFFGPAAPLRYSSAGFGPSNYPLWASSASTLFDYGLWSLELFSSGQQRLYVIRVWVSIPRIASFGHQSFHSIWIRTAVLQISVLCYQCFQMAQNMVTIRQFGCRISNTKISPLLATLDSPVFVSSALCQENFYIYGMKFASMDASSASH
jgi:hypothetical protein